MDFLEELEKGPMMVSPRSEILLAEQASSLGSPACALVIHDSAAVTAMHQESLALGARLITTNTAQANEACLSAVGLGDHVNEINWLAAQMACAEAKTAGAFAAGRVTPPPGEFSGTSLEKLLTTQVGALLDGGCRVILFDRFSEPGSLLLALEVKNTLHHCPAIYTIHVESMDPLHMGPAIAASQTLAKEGAEVIGWTGPAALDAALLFSESSDHSPLAAFPEETSRTIEPGKDAHLALLGGFETPERLVEQFKILLQSARP